MFCNKCGKEIGNDEEKCPFCGGEMESQSLSESGGSKLGDKLRELSLRIKRKLNARSVLAEPSLFTSTERSLATKYFFFFTLSMLLVVFWFSKTIAFKLGEGLSMEELFGFNLGAAKISMYDFVSALGLIGDSLGKMAYADTSEALIVILKLMSLLFRLGTVCVCLAPLTAFAALIIGDFKNYLWIKLGRIFISVGVTLHILYFVLIKLIIDSAAKGENLEFSVRMSFAGWILLALLIALLWLLRVIKHQSQTKYASVTKTQREV